MHPHSKLLALIAVLVFSPPGAGHLHAADLEALERFESPVTFTPFETGDRVAFLGDSITASGDYVHMLRLFYATRFPDRPVRLYNCGIGGERADTSWRRINGDCLDLDPTMVSIMLGMNDAGTAASHAVVTKYQDYMTRIMDRIAEVPERKLALIVSSPYDQTAQLAAANRVGKNDTIRAFGKWLAGQGRDRAVPVVDFNTPLLRINAERQKVDPEFSVIGPDRVHPGVQGHTVMTYCFLRGQGIAGPVARVEVNAAAGTAKTENAGVTGLETKNGRLSFVYTPKALPYPAEALPFASPGQEWVPFTEELNREWLVVRGLAQGRWALTMEGKTVGAFTSDELAAGIDLACETNSASYRQSHEVFAVARQVEEAERNLRAIARINWLILKPRKIDLDDTARADAVVREYLSKRLKHAYWQNRGEVFFRFRAPEKRAAERARMEALMDRLYEINQPRPQRVELRHAAAQLTNPEI